MRTPTLSYLRLVVSQAAAGGGGARLDAGRGVRAAVLVLLLAFLIGGPSPVAASPPVVPPAQLTDAREIEALISQLTPLERVAQLFLVPDVTLGEDPAAFADFLQRYPVGGVVLQPGIGRFTNGPDAPTQVAALANALQAGAAARSPFVPLFVALDHSGDRYPDRPLWGGMTPLPSPMALGATWRPEHAERVGEIAGQELAAVGVNLMLGPSLDVLYVPRPGSSGDLGVRSFGGSPPWVARFGTRYVDGVHAGGDGRVATAVGRFPGVGGADRSPDEEGAVVDSALPQLVGRELVPFVAVAEGPSGAPGEPWRERPPGTTDAFVTSHVRYRGIQQQVDRPLSLDSLGLNYLWAQVPALHAWREDGGGLLVSGGLGLPAVRRYVDPNLDTFNARRVLREALLAGHDVLTVTRFGPADDPAVQRANIEAGISWLVEAYGEDDSIREAVDDALRRVLTLKSRLMPRWRYEAVRVDAPSAALRTGLGAETAAAVARDALTRITPAGAPGASGAATAPEPGERILLVVDARTVRECPACEPYLDLDPAALLAVVRRAYGPEGTGSARIRSNDDVMAITFEELKAWLAMSGQITDEDSPVQVSPLDEPRRAEVTALLETADWLVFAMRDVDPSEAPASDALKLFLKAVPERDRQRRVALAFGAPYYLDTTEIARLDTYYALYARGAPFAEVAVRALFGDEAATGASPVSVPGAGYELDRRLQPEVDQAVALELVGRAPESTIDAGERFAVRTSVIRDANGHPVPDGTRATFRRRYPAEGFFLPDVETVTEAGRAAADIRAERAGQLEVTVSFDNGLLSGPLTLSIVGEAPTPGETAPAALVPLPPSWARPRVPVDWGILLLSLSGMVLAAVLVYSADPRAARAPTRMVRLVLLSLAWGLAGYLLVAAGGLQLEVVPALGVLWPEGWSVAYQAPVISFFFALLPLIPTLVRTVRER